MADKHDGPEQLRLSRAIEFLRSDPNNLTLLAEGARAAVAVFDYAAVGAFLSRYAAIAELPQELVNIRGVVALRDGRFAEADAIFSALLDQGADNASLRFNLAWAKAMQRDYEAADAIISGGPIETPQAAALKVRMLQSRAELELAMAEGARLAERFPQDVDLMGAMATVALDMEDAELARSYALRAPHHHDGLSTLGMLDLEEGRAAEARIYFDQALKATPNSGRALLGRGLTQALEGDLEAAILSVALAAQTFKDHNGSWLTLGWLRLVKGDYPAARKSMDHALSLDDNFGEAHGALAVLDVLEGHIEEARQRVAVALRLDRQCFSAIVAKGMIADSGGDTTRGRRLGQLALETPIEGSSSGKTLGQAMIALGRF